MESILLGGDDDSSDDDDNTGLEGSLAASVPAAAAVAPPSSMAPSDLSARLKSLYSPANKAVPSPAAVPAPVQQRPPQQQQRQPSLTQQPMQMQQVPPQQQQPMQQSHNRLPQQHHPQQVMQQQQPRRSHSNSHGGVGSVPHPMARASSATVPQSMPMQQANHLQSSVSTSRIPPAQQQQRTSSSSRPLAPNRPRDPFEPTPLTTMISRQSSGGPAPSSSQPLPLHPQRPPSTSSTNSTSTVRTSNMPPHMQPVSHHHPSAVQAPLPSANLSNSVNRAKINERDAKKAKEQFLMFTRVLMKYLEQKDGTMHARAKQVIRECAERNKKKEQGYESVTQSMKTRLRETVGEPYWKRAESYLTHFQEMQRKKKAAAVGGPSQPQPSSSGSNSIRAQQQAALQKKMAEQKEVDRRNKYRQDQIEKQKKDIEMASARQKAEDRKRSAQQKMQEQQQQQQKAQMKQQQQAHVKQQQAQAAAKIEAIKKSNAQQLALIKQQTAAGQKASSTAPRSTTPSTSDKKRKSSSSSTSSAAAAAAARIKSPDASSQQQQQPTEAPPREYNELMEMVDHAVDYDWTSAGLLLGPTNKSEIDLNAEQRTLLYSNHSPPVTSDNQLRRGWNDRNVVSARAAWARVRLPEYEREAKAVAGNNVPVVAGISIAINAIEAADTKMKTTWFNEDRAEQDRTLAVLSEATQMYMKQVLDKALQCARQRENLEGIRLWHMQHSGSKPPIGLRLGCDVSRQVALAAGNAARTVQRMEEALERNPSDQRDLSDATVLDSATSMGDLACRPKLATGVEKANYHAKRSFETSGGKDTAAPLGRVPKKAKIMAHDFQMGMELTDFRQPRAVAFNFV